jgi:sporulation integral membrane protein YtvI
MKLSRIFGILNPEKKRAERGDSLETQKYKDFLLKFGYWAAIALIVYLIWKYLFVYLLPFLIAYAVASLLRPAVVWLGKKLHIRSGPISVVLALFVYIFVAGALILLSVGIVTEVVDLVSGMPEYYTSSIAPALDTLGNKILDMLSHLDPSTVKTIEDMVPDALSSLGSAVTKFSMQAVSWASGTAVEFPAKLMAAVICIIATVFMAADFGTVNAYIKKHLPEKAIAVLRSARRSLGNILGNYAKSYAIILFLTFAELSVGLLLIGYEKAVLIALIIAVFDIMPIVGSGTILLPWAIISLVQGNVGHGIALIVLYVVVVIVRQIMEPKIVGQRVGLHPLATLLCMWLGAKLFGVIGLFGLPVSVLIIKELRANGTLSHTQTPDEAHS